MKYLIEQAWVDPLENRVDFGYDIVGYVTTEDEAISIVERGGKFKGDETWSLRCRQDQPTKYRYRRIDVFSLE